MSGTRLSKEPPRSMPRTPGCDMTTSSATSGTLHCFDGFYSHSTDCDILSASATSQRPIKTYQMLGVDIADHSYTSTINNQDAWWGATDPQLDEAVRQQFEYEYQDCAGLLTPLLHHLSPLIVHEDDDTDTGPVWPGTDPTTYCEKISEITEPPNLLTTTGTHPDPPDIIQVEPPSSSRKRRRKQNHSCDPCRLAKRACDLSLSVDIHNLKPSKGCATCNTRGLECTAAWLANRNSRQHDGKRARARSYIFGTGDTVDDGAFNVNDDIGDVEVLRGLTSISAPEADMTRQVMAQQTCTQQFNLYVDIWDMPMTECLSHMGMRPNQSDRFGALTKLSHSASFSKYFSKAQSWIKNYWQIASNPWDATSAAPHVFFVVSMLDALFQQRGDPTCRLPTESRETSINEVYRWVALANAAQFAVRLDAGDKSPRARDLASNTWCKARQLVFENIAATSSFRLALALLLFGITLPPTTDPNGSEDAAYALSEGVRRLWSLSAQARSSFAENHQSKTQSLQMSLYGATRVHPVQGLPSHVREMILELIDIVDSLANIINWVVIGLSGGQLCASSPGVYEANVAGEDLKGDAGQRVMMNSCEGTTRHERDLHDIITTQTRAERKAVTVLWSQGAEDEVVLRAVHDSVSLVVMMWKSLALLTVAVQNVGDDEPIYEEIRRHHASMSTLVDAWRSAFGRFDETPSISIQHSGPNLRRSILFCSTDGDIAVLQLYKLVHQLELELAKRPSTTAKARLLMALQSTRAQREANRLTSAMQISLLALASQGVSSPGFQGGDGLKAFVHDIAAHPHPHMMVHALSLAAKTFNDEVHNCLTRMDTQGASSMMVHLDACLKGLQGLKETLVMFPDIDQSLTRVGESV